MAKQFNSHKRAAREGRYDEADGKKKEEKTVGAHPIWAIASNQNRG